MLGLSYLTARGTILLLVDVDETLTLQWSRHFSDLHAVRLQPFPF